MRQQSKNAVIIRGVTIGGPYPLVCLPLVAKKNTDVLKQAEEIVALKPDMLEWRIDGYDNVEDIKDCLAALLAIRAVIGNIPLILTCRSHMEGGLVTLSQDKRLALISAAIKSGDIDIVDIEMCNDADFISTVVGEARAGGVKLILSYHNFTKTPDEAFLVSKLSEGQRLGADISKLAVMPKDYADVLTLLSATNLARNGKVNVPIITMAMGEEGKITRLAGGLFGSDITFALGTEPSAPGQIPLAEMRRVMDVIY